MFKMEIKELKISNEFRKKVDMICKKIMKPIKIMMILI